MNGPRDIGQTASFEDAPRKLSMSDEGGANMDYVIEVATRLASRAGELPGMRIVSQPRQLRHFTARFAPLH